MGELLGYRAYARHRKVTLGAVQKAIKAGRIQPIQRDGKFLIDREQADRDWTQKTDLAKRSLIHSAGPDITSASSDLDLEDDDFDNIENPPNGDKRLASDETSDEYRSSRAAREKIRVDREMLELDQLRGKLVNVEEAKRTAFTAFRMLRDAILNVPPRVKDLCAAETDAMRIEQLLETELTAALGAFKADSVLRDVEEDDDQEF